MAYTGFGFRFVSIVDLFLAMGLTAGGYAVSGAVGGPLSAAGREVVSTLNWSKNAASSEFDGGNASVESKARVEGGTTSRRGRQCLSKDIIAR